MQELLTPKQVARAIGVSEASLKRWCDKGLLVVQRTVGGHRRLPIDGVMEFLRKSNRPLVRPEILGLPSTTGRGEAVLNRAVQRLYETLEVGDEEAVRGILFDLHLSNHRLDAICDKVVVPALQAIDRHVSEGQCKYYQKTRATETFLRSFYRLSVGLQDPAPDAPTAICATLLNDTCTRGITMGEMILKQIGWKAQSLGSRHDAQSLREAMEDLRPRLFWCCVSEAASADAFVVEYEKVFQAASDLGVAIAIGGIALTDNLRERIQYSAYCDNFSRLVSFAEALYRPSEA